VDGLQLYVTNMCTKFKRGVFIVEEFAVISEILKNARGCAKHQAHQFSSWIGLQANWRAENGVGRDDRRQIVKIVLRNHCKPIGQGFLRGRNKWHGQFLSVFGRLIRQYARSKGVPESLAIFPK
jgi:hypothetical protein